MVDTATRLEIKNYIFWLNKYYIGSQVKEFKIFSKIRSHYEDIYELVLEGKKEYQFYDNSTIFDIEHREAKKLMIRSSSRLHCKINLFKGHNKHMGNRSNLAKYSTK